MEGKPVYSKRLSWEELREEYILVLKKQLAYFPTVGKPFQLVRDGHSRKSRVESYPCNCRDPDKPHEHFLHGQKVSRPETRLQFEETPARTLVMFLFS